MIGEAGDGREAVELTLQLQPDVLLMDLAMPHVNGIQALQHLGTANCVTRTVILSMHADEILVREAVQHGAKSYLLKGSASDELLLAIRAAYRGAAYFSSAVAASIAAESGPSKSVIPAKPLGPPITPRELELLRLISEGHTNSEISRLMRISVKTVERHRSNLMAKLNAHNLVELIRIAVKRRLIRLDDEGDRAVTTAVAAGFTSFTSEGANGSPKTALR